MANDSNLRTFTGVDRPFAEFNREERNLAAIFFHAVNLPGNLDRFLAAAGCRPVEPGFEPAVYFEYSYLRDLWNQLDTNAAKRSAILEFLPLQADARLRECSIQEFNQFFGVANVSSKHIQCPANWSISLFDKTIADPAEFLAACRFKWTFNAKPDLVVDTGPERRVCIEAKLESGEGSYPSSKVDKLAFDKRGLKRQRQTDVQRYAMEDLLGFDTEFLLLARKATAQSDHRFITWAQAFDAMESDSLPQYMRATISSMAG